MRRTITILAAALCLAFAGTSLARDLEDGKLIIKITKDGKYQVGDAIIVDKVGMYGAVGGFFQEGKDKASRCRASSSRRRRKRTTSRNT